MIAADRLMLLDDMPHIGHDSVALHVPVLNPDRSPSKDQNGAIIARCSHLDATAARMPQRKLQAAPL